MKARSAGCIVPSIAKRINKGGQDVEVERSSLCLAVDVDVDGSAQPEEGKAERGVKVDTQGDGVDSLFVLSMAVLLFGRFDGAVVN